MGNNQSVTLLDLMELWTIGRESPFYPGQPAESIEYLKYIISTANVDNRINTEILAFQILRECGAMQPLYNSVGSFQVFAVNWLRSRREQLVHLLDSLFTTYSPLEEFNWHEREILNGRKKTDDTRNITDNDTIQNDGGYTNSGTTNDVNEHGVSADNESGFQNRERDGRTVTDTLTNTHTDTTTDARTKRDALDGLEKTDNITDRDFYGHKKSNMELLLEEFEIAQKNVYDLIVAWWTDALMLGVY